MMTDRRTRFPFRFRCFLLGALVPVLTFTGGAANGVIYYNRYVSSTAPPAVRRIGGDGAQDQAVVTPVTGPLYPTLSRNGRSLLLTALDPARPFKMSNNVYVQDVATGALRRLTSYEDEAVLNGVRFDRDLQQLAGNQTISSYKIHFPYHKALSPDGTRLVVMNLFKSGAVTMGSAFSPNDITFSSGRFPIVDVFRVSDALPAGAYIFLSAQERTGFNQGGDGVDWHPSLEQVVATVSSDIPAVGNAGITSTEGTVIAVFASSGTSTFLRKLTNPTSQVDIISGAPFYFGVHDYAPAISPDGQQVAYVRHILRQGPASGYAPYPAQCVIRVVNYDGTGDRQVLSLAEGAWVTKVAWSPDKTQIAFDLAPQAVLSGRYSQLGDVTQSQIHVVNATGTNPRLLAAGPAAYPSWGPEVAPVTLPRIQLTGNRTALQLRIDGLVPPQAFRVESATSLNGPWSAVLNTNATATTQTVNITPNASARAAFYRVALP